MMDWDQVYRAHHSEVFRYLCYRTSGNRELAADLTHDVFVRAIKAQDRFVDDGRGPGPWLATIARHLLIDHFKSSPVRREIARDDMHDLDHALPSTEDLVLGDQDAAGLRAAVARLMPDQREAVLLSYWADLPDAQIAARVGCTTRTVNTRRFRAREVLRRRLAGVAA